MSRIDKMFWDTLRGPKQWVSPWFVAYALVGAVSSGLIPILLPLMMVRLLPHELAAVGYVIGAFDLGALSSPLWGNWADAKKAFRLVFCGGLLLEIVAMVLFPMAANLGAWLIMALLMGAGSAAVSTCATLLIVEFYPTDQWTSRIGWLQTFNGTGQVIGLLLAGACVTIGYKFGLWMGAGLLLAAVAVGLVFLPRPSRDKKASAKKEISGINLDFESLARFARVELVGGGMLKHLHVLNLAGLKSMLRLLPTRFGRFLLSWLLLFLGVAGFFAYFPIFMKQSFGVLPATTSVTYALAAGVGIALYNLAGMWSQKVGPQKIYFFGRILRMTGFVLLLAPLLIHTLPGANFMALLGFAVVVLAWPILSVTGTELTSELSPITQGAAQGLNNAANGVGTVGGTYLAGWLVHVVGYECIPMMALIGLALSVLVDTSFRRSRPM
ncbi:MAG: MFS transporter [Planctomycetia bacterium]|nr:MFS transporter [Planctomycetia bacterium]